MAEPRFDILARTLAAPCSRRRILAGLIGTILGLASRTPTSAAGCPILSPCWTRQHFNLWSGEAAAPDTPDTQPVASEAESVPISDVGVIDRGQSDGPAEEVCYGEDCDRGPKPAPPQCPTGLTKCGGVCVNLSSDPNNCGACGVRCPTGWMACSGGTCTCTTWCTVRTCQTITRNGTPETRCFDNVQCC